MIIDLQNQLADAVAITTATTTVSTNTLDLLRALNGIGDGEPMAVVFTVEGNGSVATTGADFTTTDETYTFELITSAAANLSSPTVISSRAVSAAGTATEGGTSLLALGRRVVMNIPMDAVKERYFGSQIVTAGTSPGLTYSANIVPLSFVQNNGVYADGITIS